MWLTIAEVRQCAGVEVPILGMVTQVAGYRCLDGPVLTFISPVSLDIENRGEDCVDV